jgi:DHA1 family tetracycline resistance protein-like MFS transporter
MRKPSIGIIFLTVFIDLVGFGLILPLMPVFAKNFGASAMMVGVIVAAFSAMQFMFAPFWGQLSDRIGRRPVLLMSTATASVSYLLFAMGCYRQDAVGLWIILGSRALAGVCGANIGVAQAYIADITPPEQRSRKMGLIGMAFGLGFIFGPALGGAAVKWIGYTGPGLVAATLCACNFLFAFARLPESWSPQAEHVPSRPHLEQWKRAMSLPGVSMLIVVFFLATFCFTTFETTLGLVVSKNFGLNPEEAHSTSVIAMLFVYCGVLGAVVQGGLVGKVVDRIGERNAIVISLVLTAVGLAPVASFDSWLPLLVFLFPLAVGSSLARPPIFGLLSRLTPSGEQGSTIGVAQSMGSLARIIGPLFAMYFYRWSVALPYLICTGVLLLASIIAWVRLHEPRQQTELRRS